jgi:hypothetical protein
MTHTPAQSHGGIDLAELDEIIEARGIDPVTGLLNPPDKPRRRGDAEEKAEVLPPVFPPIPPRLCASAVRFDTSRGA